MNHMNHMNHMSHMSQNLTVGRVAAAGVISVTACGGGMEMPELHVGRATGFGPLDRPHPLPEIA
jgi:hypothetical protein